MGLDSPEHHVDTFAIVL